QLLFEEFGADLIERTGRDPGGGNAQRLGFGENRLVLQAKLLRDVVNANGHKFSPSPTGMCERPSWLTRVSQRCFGLRHKFQLFIRLRRLTSHPHQAGFFCVRLRLAPPSKFRPPVRQFAGCCANRLHPPTTNPPAESARHAPARRPARPKFPEWPRATRRLRRPFPRNLW